MSLQHAHCWTSVAQTESDGLAQVEFHLIDGVLNHDLVRVHVLGAQELHGIVHAAHGGDGTGPHVLEGRHAVFAGSDAGEAEALVVEGAFGFSDGLVVSGGRDVHELPADLIAAFPGEGAELGADFIGEPLVAGREIALQIAADQHLVL